MKVLMKVGLAMWNSFEIELDEKSEVAKSSCLLLLLLIAFRAFVYHLQLENKLILNVENLVSKKYKKCHHELRRVHCVSIVIKFLIRMKMYNEHVLPQIR